MLWVAVGTSRRPTPAAREGSEAGTPVSLWASQPAMVRMCFDSFAFGGAVVFQPLELGGGEKHGGILTRGFVEGIAHLLLKGCALEGGAEVYVGADEDSPTIVVEENYAVALAGDADGGDVGWGDVGLGEGVGD